MGFLQRLLIGDAPWAFLLEILYRAVVVYLLLMLTMRLMGKRVAAQLSIAERTVILMLGAAIALPMQVYTQGLLPAVVVLGVTLALQRGQARLSFRTGRFERAAQGDVHPLLEEGRLRLDILSMNKLSRETFIAELRGRDVRQLGELRRAYLESSGAISLIQRRRPQPGLGLYPADAPAQPTAAGLLACGYCGQVVPAQARAEHACAHCGRTAWEAAVK